MSIATWDGRHRSDGAAVYSFRPRRAKGARPGAAGRPDEVWAGIGPDDEPLEGDVGCGEVGKFHFATMEEAKAAVDKAWPPAGRERRTR